VSRPLTNAELANQLDRAAQRCDWPEYEVVAAAAVRLRALPEPVFPEPQLLVDVMRDWPDGDDAK
jgi:hypothetical protein